jgi:hypothetical protein
VFFLRSHIRISREHSPSKRVRSEGIALTGGKGWCPDPVHHKYIARKWTKDLANTHPEYSKDIQNFPRTFRIFPANLTEMSPAWEVFRPFTVFPGDFLIRKCVGKFKMFPKNVPTVFLGGSSKVFFTMSPMK